jgi:hypothetical protein
MTHTKDEALKLALEALLINCGGNTDGVGKEAITAIKQALAVPTVQEPVALGKPTDEMIQAATDEYDEWAFDNKGTTECIRAMLAKALKVQPTPAQPAPLPARVTEEMHIAAVKVLHRANGVDGLPQRMLDAMLAVQPAQPANNQRKVDMTKDNEKPVAIEYWAQDTMESGRWATTGRMTKAIANRLLSDEFSVLYPMARIVEPLEETNAAQPAVPDAFGTREGEHPQYVQGFNDCRAEMLKGMK